MRWLTLLVPIMQQVAFWVAVCVFMAWADGLFDKKDKKN